MVVGIGDVERIASDGDTSGFSEPCRFDSGTSLTVAQERGGPSCFQIDRLDLVVVAVGDIKRAVVEGDAERVLQSGLVADSIDVSECEQRLASRQVVCSDDSRDLSTGAGVDLSDRGSLAVGDEQVLAVGGERRGLSESGLVEWSVGDIFSAGAGEDLDAG